MLVFLEASSFKTFLKTCIKQETALILSKSLHYFNINASAECTMCINEL